MVEAKRGRLNELLCGHEEVMGDWITYAEVVRETARKVHVFISGQRK